MLSCVLLFHRTRISTRLPTRWSRLTSLSELKRSAFRFITSEIRVLGIPSSSASSCCFLPRLRTFNVIDDYNREALHIEIDVSLTAERITRALDQVLLIRGVPERIRVDHGPEFTSATFVAWCQSRHIVIDYTQPGKPTQNAYIERFNGSYRQGVLDAWCFMNLTQVREETACWLVEYNTIRPHEALGDVSPIEFLTDRGHADVSSYAW